MPDFDVHRSLVELDPETWQSGGLAEDAPASVLRLSAKPVRRLSAEDLYPLVRMNLSLPFTAPLALEALQEDPLLQAAEYPGDLLTALMESDSRFWLDQYALWLEGVEIIERAVTAIRERMEAEERGEYMPWHIGDDFMGALMHFRGIHA